MGRHINPRILVTVSERANDALTEYKNITGQSKSKTISELLNSAVEQLEESNKLLAQLKKQQISANETILKSAQFGHKKIDDIAQTNIDIPYTDKHNDIDNKDD